MISVIPKHKTISIKEIKARSRGQLNGNYRGAVLIVVLFGIVRMFLNNLSFYAMTLSGMTGIVIGYLVSFGLELFLAVIQVGIYCFFLKTACGGQGLPSDITYGLRNFPDSIIRIQFVLSLLFNTIMLPFNILSDYVQAGENSLTGIGNAGIVVYSSGALGGAIMLWLMLGLSMVYFLLLDFPGRNVFWYLSRSWIIMNGSRLRLLGMIISFIPMFLVGLIAFCVPLPWIMSYWFSSLTNFYLDLIRLTPKQILTNDR